MDDEDILRKLHPNVSWNQLSEQIKELIKQARTDEREKQIYCPTHKKETLLYCAVCLDGLEKDIRADERAKCYAEFDNTPLERFEKEAYAKGQADLIENLQEPLSKWAGELSYTIYDDGVRCRGMESNEPSNFSEEGRQKIAKSIISVVKKASESLGNREIAHVNHGTGERSIPSGKPPQTKPEKPFCGICHANDCYHILTQLAIREKKVKP